MNNKVLATIRRDIAQGAVGGFADDARIRKIEQLNMGYLVAYDRLKGEQVVETRVAYYAGIEGNITPKWSMIA